MDPWADALNYWATPNPNHEDQPTTCSTGQIVFDHPKTAAACQRELEDLGHPRQRIQACPLGEHYHLNHDPNDLDTVRQIRSRRLLWLLNQTGSRWVDRLPVRDDIDWGMLSGVQKKKHFNRMLAVLLKYGLVSLVGTHVRVDDLGAIADLVNRIGGYGKCGTESM